MDSKKILMVDDDEDVLDSIRELLEIKFPNAEIDIAEDGVQALEFVKQNSYALIITDYKMPNMDGQEFLENAHQILKDKLPPCLFISGYFDSDQSEKIPKEIKDRVRLLAKPLQPNMFVSEVKKLL